MDRRSNPGGPRPKNAASRRHVAKKTATGRKHLTRAERGLPPQTPEEKAAQLALARTRAVESPNNGIKTSQNPLPKDSLAALESMRFRVRAEHQDNAAACKIAHIGLEQITKVMMGKVPSKRAPSILKASIAARAEICDPVVTETRLSGTLGLAAAVGEASRRVVLVEGGETREITRPIAEVAALSGSGDTVPTLDGSAAKA